MLFSKKLPVKLKNKQKNRIFKKFKFYKNNENFFKIKSFSNYRLFLNNIKMLNFYIRKRVSRFRRGTRKEYYKKLKEKGNRVKFRYKDEKYLMKRYSSKRVIVSKLPEYLSSQFKPHKRVYLNRYRRKKNTYICFNSKKLPFSKKSTNSRMGKGKGNIKNWTLNIKSGKTVLYLIGWYSNLAIKSLRYIKMYLPGKNLTIVPSMKKRNSYFASKLLNY